MKGGDVEQFRSDIRANLERELKGALMNRLRREVGEQLIAAYSSVEMPPRLVENEARAMLAQQVEQRAATARTSARSRPMPTKASGRRRQARAGRPAGR